MNNMMQFLNLRRQGVSSNEIYDAATQRAFEEAERRTNARTTEFEERVQSADTILRNLLTAIEQNNQQTLQEEQGNLNTLRVNTTTQRTALEQAQTTLTETEDALEKQREKIELLEKALKQQIADLENKRISKDVKKIAKFAQERCEARSKETN